MCSNLFNEMVALAVLLPDPKQTGWTFEHSGSGSSAITYWACGSP